MFDFTKINNFAKNNIDNITNFFGDNNVFASKLKNSFPHSFSDMLTYRSYDEHTELYYNEVPDKKGKSKISYGFILKAIPTTYLTEKDIKTLSSIFTSYATEGMIVQIMNYASPRVGNRLDIWKNARIEQGIYQKLAENRINHFKDSAYTSLFPKPFSLKEYELYISVSLDEETKNADKILIDTKTHFSDALSNIKIHNTALQPSDLISLLDEILNPVTNKKHKSVKKWDRLNNINSQLVSPESYFNIKYNEIELKDEIVARSFFVEGFPEIWSGWEMKTLLGAENEDMLNLSCPSLSVFSFYVPVQSRVKNKAIAKDIRLKQKLNKRRGAGFSLNLDEQAKEFNFIVKHLNKGQKLVESQYRVILLAHKDNADKEEATLKKIFENESWILSRENFVQEPGFLGSLPFWTSKERWKEFKKISRTKTMLSWTCANISPVIADYRGIDKDPCMLFFSRKGQPIFWSPFICPANGNYNVAVVGRSGSGKSFFMQDIVQSIRGCGGRVFIIDDGKSFKNSAIVQDGKFIEIKPGASINPLTIFDWEIIIAFIEAEAAKGSHNLSQAEYDELQYYKISCALLLTSLVCQMCKSQDIVTDVEKAIIDLAVHRAIDKIALQAREYRSQGLTIKESLVKVDAIKNGVKGLNLIRQEMDSDEICINEHQKRIAQDLQISFKSFINKYQIFFEKESDIKMDQKLLVFELSNIKGDDMKDLKAMFLMMLMYMVSEVIYKGDRKTRSALIIDEAWDMFSGGAMKHFIEGFVRRVRKYGGSLITGTQSADDYQQNPAVQAVWANTQYKCFLSTSGEEVVKMKKSGTIKEGDKALENAMISLKREENNNYSEVLVMSDAGWFVARIIVDKFSAFLYSTTAQEVAAIEDLKKQGLSTQEAITKLIN